MHGPCLMIPLAVALASCGGTLYSAGARAHFDPGSAGRQVTEEDIRQAFDARPQMPDRVRVAFYTFDATGADAIAAALRSLPRVDGTYAIPSLLVTGRRRFDDERTWEPTHELGLHQLRLLAARAHCDVLVAFDHGWRAERTVNAWATFNVLLVPALFTPYIDMRVQSYLDAYVIDVRNGYLYRQTTSSSTERRQNLTAWASPEGAIAESQWTALLEQTRDSLAAAISRESDASGRRVARR